MELKLEMIAAAAQSLSITGDRTLSIRAIANLGATKDAYDCIDLSNNEIQKLDNVPLLNRLSTLIVANNRITKIGADIHQYIPNLISLVLTSNNIKTLADLVPIFGLKDLDRLSLIDNPVLAVPYFKEFVVHCMPALRYLNFCKIKYSDRLAYQKFFNTPEGLAILVETDHFPPYYGEPPKDAKKILEKMQQTKDVDTLLNLEKQLMESQSKDNSDK